MIEIGRLAVYLRHQDALDSEGIIAAQMARDLADTEPERMALVLHLVRLRCTWLPKTAELLEIYSEEVERHRGNLERKRAEEARRDDEIERFERATHPEKFVSIRDTLAELGYGDEYLAMKDRRVKSAAVTATPAPETTACPYCGHTLLNKVSDMRFFTVADLEAMLDRRRTQQQMQQRAICKVASPEVNDGQA